MHVLSLSITRLPFWQAGLLFFQLLKWITDCIVKIILTQVNCINKAFFINGREDATNYKTRVKSWLFYRFLSLPINGFSSHSGKLWLLQTLFACVCESVCICLSVCPAFTAFISVTVGQILMKLGRNVGTEVRLIFLKCLENQVYDDVSMGYIWNRG